MTLRPLAEELNTWSIAVFRMKSPFTSQQEDPRDWSMATVDH